MDLHEYQAKAFLQQFSVPVPKHWLVRSIHEAENIVYEFGLNRAVVKVQIHAGGRGKAGGVILCKSREEIFAAVKELFGKKIVTKQTGPRGMISNTILIEIPVQIAAEYYLAATIDRKQGRAILLATNAGGMDIEESQEAMTTIPIETTGEVRNYHLIYLAKSLGWPIDKIKPIVKGIAKAFIESDASLLEINPLVRTVEGDFVAIDAKMTIDDNAFFRQKFLFAEFDETQHPETEILAKKQDLSYVAMEGTIGCMVNGAGLAMATMDIIHSFGGSPANFLDVGGSATSEKVAEGFKLICKSPQVKAILVNIFGGIMNCKTVAEGVLQAANELQLKMPLVVRLEGTNVEEGKKILAESGLKIVVAENLADAAEKVVRLGHSL